MNTEKSLQLIGVVLFLFITVLTYYVMIPLSPEINSTTNTTMNTTTNTTSEISPLTNAYRIMISLTSGGVIGIVTVSFLYSARQH